MAEEFNVYFSSIAERLQNDIPSVELSPVNYVNCNMPNSLFLCLSVSMNVCQLFPNLKSENVALTCCLLSFD